MFKAKFVSNCMDQDIQEIKLAALYYDEIEIMENIVYTLEIPKLELIGNKKHLTSKIRGVHDCIASEFRMDLKELEKEKIINYTECRDYSIESMEDTEYAYKLDNHEELLIKAMKQASNLINSNDILWLSKDFKTFKFDPEVIKVHSKFIGALNLGSQVDMEFIFKYYRNLLTYLIHNVMSSENVLTSSSILDRYMHQHYLSAITRNLPQDYKELEIRRPNVAMDAIKIYLPNVSNMHVSDILELRYKLKDELENFKYSINALNKELTEKYNETEILTNSVFCVKSVITPAVKELESKIKGTKLNIASKFIDELKDPKSYTPFIGNFLFNLPSQLALLLSLGLISTKSAMEYLREKEEIKNNGMYFLINISKENQMYEK